MKNISFYRLIVISMLFSLFSIGYCEGEKLLYPTSFKWVQEWEHIQSSPDIHQSLKDARIILPAYSRDEKLFTTLNLCNNKGEIIGDIWVKNDWSQFIAVHLRPVYTENKTVFIDYVAAENVAKKFISDYIPKRNGVEVCINCKKINSDGYYDILFKYYKNDLFREGVSFQIDYTGRIIQVDLGVPNHDIDKLPVSPGKEQIITYFSNLLNNQDFRSRSLRQAQ